MMGRKRSWVWQHYTVSRGNATCNMCSTVLWIGGSTTHLIKHLKTIHSMKDANESNRKRRKIMLQKKDSTETSTSLSNDAIISKSSIYSARKVNYTSEETAVASTSKEQTQIGHINSNLLDEQIGAPLVQILNPLRIKLNLKSINRQKDDSLLKVNPEVTRREIDNKYSETSLSEEILNGGNSNEANSLLDKNVTVTDDEISDCTVTSESKRIDEDNANKKQANWKKKTHYALNTRRMLKLSKLKKKKNRKRRKEKPEKIRQKFRDNFGETVLKSENKKEHYKRIKKRVPERTKPRARKRKLSFKNSQDDTEDEIPTKSVAFTEHFLSDTYVNNNEDISYAIEVNNMHMSIKDLHILSQRIQKELDITYTEEKEEVNMQKVIQNVQKDQELSNNENAGSMNEEKRESKTGVKSSTTSTKESPFRNIQEKNDVDSIEHGDVLQNIENSSLNNNDSITSDIKSATINNASIAALKPEENLLRDEHIVSTLTDASISPNQSNTSDDNDNNDDDNDNDDDNNEDDDNTDDLEIQIKIKPKSKSRVSRKFLLQAPFSVLKSYLKNLNLLEVNPDFLPALFEANLRNACKKTTYDATIGSEESNTSTRSLEVNQNVPAEIIDTVSNTQEAECDFNYIAKDNSLQQENFRAGTTLKARNATKDNEEEKNDQIQPDEQERARIITTNNSESTGSVRDMPDLETLPNIQNITCDHNCTTKDNTNSSTRQQDVTILNKNTMAHNQADRNEHVQLFEQEKTQSSIGNSESTRSTIKSCLRNKLLSKISLIMSIKKSWITPESSSESDKSVCDIPNLEKQPEKNTILNEEKNVTKNNQEEKSDRVQSANQEKTCITIESSFESVKSTREMSNLEEQLPLNMDNQKKRNEHIPSVEQEKTCMTIESSFESVESTREMPNSEEQLPLNMDNQKKRNEHIPSVEQEKTCMTIESSFESVESTREMPNSEEQSSLNTKITACNSDSTIKNKNSFTRRVRSSAKLRNHCPSISSSIPNALIRSNIMYSGSTQVPPSNTNATRTASQSNTTNVNLPGYGLANQGNTNVPLATDERYYAPGSRTNDTALASTINTSQQNQICCPFAIRKQIQFHRNIFLLINNNAYNASPTVTVNNTAYHKTGTAARNVELENSCINPQTQIPQVPSERTQLPQYNTLNKTVNTSSSCRRQIYVAQNTPSHYLPVYVGVKANLPQQNSTNPILQQQYLQQNAYVNQPSQQNMINLILKQQHLQQSLFTNRSLQRNSPTANVQQSLQQKLRANQSSQQNLINSTQNPILQSLLSNNSSGTSETDKTASSKKNTPITSSNQILINNFDLSVFTDLQKILLRDQLNLYFNITEWRCPVILEEVVLKKLIKLISEKITLTLFLEALHNYVNTIINASQTAEKDIEQGSQNNVLQETSEIKENKRPSVIKFAKTKSDQVNKNNLPYDKNLKKQSPRQNINTNIPMNSESATIENKSLQNASTDKTKMPSKIVSSNENTRRKSNPGKVIEVQKVKKMQLQKIPSPEIPNTENICNTSNAVTLNNNKKDDVTLQTPSNTADQNTKICNVNDQTSSKNQESEMCNIEELNCAEKQSEASHMPRTFTPILSKSESILTSSAKKYETTEISLATSVKCGNTIDAQNALTHLKLMKCNKHLFLETEKQFQKLTPNEIRKTKNGSDICNVVSLSDEILEQTSSFTEETDNETFESSSRLFIDENADINSDSQYEQSDKESLFEEDTRNVVQDLRNPLKMEKSAIKKQSPLLEDDAEIDFINKSLVMSEQDIENVNKQLPLETEEMQLRKILPLEIPVASSTEENTMQSINTINQSKDIEEKNVTVDIHNNIKAINELFRHVSEQKYYGKLRVSSCSFTKNSPICAVVKEDNFESTNLPNIVDIRSISLSLFENFDNIGTSQDSLKLPNEEKKEKLIAINDNSEMTEDDMENEMENLLCLRCKRKSTVFCGGCLEVSYCSVRCSQLHWRSHHYKVCKSCDNEMSISVD